MLGALRTPKRRHLRKQRSRHSDSCSKGIERSRLLAVELAAAGACRSMRRSFPRADSVVAQQAPSGSSPRLRSGHAGAVTDSAGEVVSRVRSGRGYAHLPCTGRDRHVQRLQRALWSGPRSTIVRSLEWPSLSVFKCTAQSIEDTFLGPQRAMGLCEEAGEGTLSLARVRHGHS